MRIFVWLQIFAIFCLLSFVLPKNVLSQDRISLLKIIEIDRSGNECNHSEARSTISIDIHSQLWITPQPDSITKLICPEPAIADRKIPEQQIKIRTMLLNVFNNTDTLAILAKDAAQLYLDKESGDSSKVKLLRGKLRDKTIEFGKLSAMRNHTLMDYLAMRGYSETEASVKINEVFPMRGDYTKLRAFVQQELQRIDIEIKNETQDIYSSASKTRMILAAQLLQNNQTNAIHLPSYDSKPNEYHTPIPKISFQLTDKQKDELKEKRQYYDKLANVVRDIQTNKNDIGGFFEKQRNAFIDILDSLRNVVSFAANIYEDAYRDGLNINAETAYHNNKDIIYRYNAFVNTLKSTRDTAITFRDMIDPIVRKLFPTSSSSTPEDYLASVIDHIDTLKGIIKKQSAALISAVEKMDNTLESFVNALKEAKGIDSTSMEYKSIQESVRLIQSIDLINLLNSNTSVIATFIESIKNSKPAVSKAIELKAFDGLLIKDGSYIEKPLSELVQTNINISTLGADEGSIIRLTVQIYDVQDENKVLYEQDQFFEVRKFGISSAVSAGLVFINAIDPAYSGKVHSVPTVSASYLFRLRPWRFEYDYVSIGVHAVTLDFDSTVPIEIGMGISLHFFNDILQTGYGWNLHAPGSPKYWYVGLGILDLLNSANKLTF